MTMMRSSTCFERCNVLPDDDHAEPTLALQLVLTSHRNQRLLTDHQLVTVGEVNLDHFDQLHARAPRFCYETRLCENPG